MDANEHKPVLIVIAGPNGSGKTSVTSKILHHEWLEDSEYINPDNVARDMFGDWNNREAVLKAANFCNDWREKCLAERKSHIFETVMSATDKVDYILRAKEAGFFIRLFFVSTESPTINAKRVANRVLNGGHDVPIPKIISRYDKSIANCIALSPYVDRLYVYDNSIEDAEAQLLFRLTDGEVAKCYVNNLPNWSKLIFPSHKTMK
ncbi:MAG: AAA family ATPase [Bacteroidales bacterium]|nr:AAA family ATPase [Bacteroidales bacterium]